MPVIRGNNIPPAVLVTSNIAAVLGVLVPIPTRPEASTLIRLFPSPSAMMMLLSNEEERPETLAPTIVFLLPVVRVGVLLRIGVLTF